MTANGWIDRYVSLYHERSPQAPTIYHQTVALHTLSSVVGRNLSFQRGAKTVYPNIWSVLTGPPGTSKKSTALDYGRDMLHSVAREMQMADCGSVEGLMAELSEKSKDGICHVWSNQDEFGSMISGMKKKDYLADLKDIFMQLYDGKPLSRRLVKMSYKLDPVYMTFISASAIERLAGLLTQDDLEDGFLSRFLLVYAEDKGFIPDSDSFDPRWSKMRDDLEYDLTQVRTAYNSYPTECVWHPEARSFFTGWRHDMDDEVRAGRLPRATAARMEDYFIKFCMLWELSDQMRYLGAKQVITSERAMDVAEKIEPYKRSMARLSRILGCDAKTERLCIAAPFEPQYAFWADVLAQSKLSAWDASNRRRTLLQSERWVEGVIGGKYAYSRPLPKVDD